MRGTRVTTRSQAALPPRRASKPHKQSGYQAQGLEGQLYLKEFNDEGSTQSDSEIDTQAIARPRRKRPSPKSPPKSKTKRRRTTREHSEDEESECSEVELFKKKKRRVASKKSAADQKRKTGRFARGKNGQTPSPKRAIVSNSDMHSDRKIPPWSSLPYHVLLIIFGFVGEPLIDDRTFQAVDNFKAVRNCSKVCRTWCEPALTVLWNNPVLTPMDRPHLLMQQLRRDSSLSVLKYRQKLEHIQMEVLQTATYKAPGYGFLDVPLLVRHCPRLSSLELYHHDDLPPYRRLDLPRGKFQYQRELLSALNHNIEGGITRLKSWRWSSRLVPQPRDYVGYDFTFINTAHIMPSFQSLKKIAFVNYQTPDMPKRIPVDFVPPNTEKDLADAITLLPRLRHLVLEACSIANGTLFPLLPNNLHHLEIIACNELTSEVLAEFLITHGSDLRSLRLNHNQALSLSFLTVLRAACPKLKILECNLAYYNLLEMSRDNEPLYPELLRIFEVPTWPSCLISVELSHLRKWDHQAAETLFKSLLQSAGELPQLRNLAISAILDNLSWRDRGRVRDKWTECFSTVFKRQNPAPNPHLRSLGAFRMWKIAEETKNEGKFVTSLFNDDEACINTHPRRLANGSEKVNGNGHAEVIELDDSNSDVPIARRPRRLPASPKGLQDSQHTSLSLSSPTMLKKTSRNIINDPFRNPNTGKKPALPLDTSPTQSVENRRPARPQIPDIESSALNPRAARPQLSATEERISGNNADPWSDFEMPLSQCKGKLGIAQAMQLSSQLDSDSDSDVPLARTRPGSKPVININGSGKAKAKDYKHKAMNRELEWLVAQEARHRAGGSRSQSYDNNSDGEEITVRHSTRSSPRLKEKTRAKMEVCVDGRSIQTPGGTTYGKTKGSKTNGNKKVKAELEADSEAEEKGAWDEKDCAVQGMCNTVELRIDNLRPTENQFTEADFLDEEPESDGDWEEDYGEGEEDDGEDGAGYAW